MKYLLFFSLVQFNLLTTSTFFFFFFLLFQLLGIDTPVYAALCYSFRTAIQISTSGHGSPYNHHVSYSDPNRWRLLNAG